MRSFVLAVAFVLSACASTMQNEPNASLQSAVYIAGESSAPSRPIATAVEKQPTDGMQAPSELKRLYWFFGGR